VTFDTLLRELRGKTPEIEPAALDAALHGTARPALIVGLAHVDRRGAAAVANRGIEGGRVDLGGLAANLAEQRVKGHHAA